VLVRRKGAMRVPLLQYLQTWNWHVVLDNSGVVVCARLHGFPTVFQTGQSVALALSHADSVRMRDLTPEQLTSVACPICGVAAGKRCLLHSGVLRSDSHVDRKLSAAETIEANRYRHMQSLAKRGARN
jgi:hypothetical protein